MCCLLGGHRRASCHACDQTYHCDCLMDWNRSDEDHNDCPQCRRLLWSPLTYANVARELEHLSQSDTIQRTATNNKTALTTLCTFVATTSNHSSDKAVPRTRRCTNRSLQGTLAMVVLVVVFGMTTRQASSWSIGGYCLPAGFGRFRTYTLLIVRDAQYGDISITCRM